MPEPEGLVGLWTFEDDCTDSVGSNDGTPEALGTPLYQYVGGKRGKAIRCFAGSFGAEPRINLQSPLITETASFSILFWLKTDTSGGFIYRQYPSGGSGNTHRIDNASGYINFHLHTDSNSQYLTCSIPDADWTHYAFTFNADTREFKAYRDGSIADSKTFPSGDLATPDTGVLMDGAKVLDEVYDLDEFRLYDRDLTDEEIVQIVNWSFPPVVPVNLTATANYTTDAIDVEWVHDGEDATGYKVYRSANGITYSLIDTVIGTSYEDTDVVYDTEYFYYVVATGLAGSSGTSNIDSAILVTPLEEAPTSLTATENYETEAIDLAWSHTATSYLQGYNIYRRVGDGGYSLLDTTTNLAYSDSSAAYDITYTYWVKAYNAKGESLSSNTDTAKLITPIEPTRSKDNPNQIIGSTLCL